MRHRSLASAALSGTLPALAVSTFYPAGWYFLHVGNMDKSSVESGVLQNIDYQSDVTDFNQIIGRIRLGKVVRPIDLSEPWHDAVTGSRCHVIEETEKFVTPVPDVHNKRGQLWISRDETLATNLQSALEHTTVVSYPARLLSATDRRPKSKAASWLKVKRRSGRLGKQYPKHAEATVSDVSDAMPRNMRYKHDDGSVWRHSDRPQQPAASPATLGLSAAAAVVNTRHADDPSLAARLAAGRTVPRLLHLMSFHFLQPLDPFESSPTDLKPVPGLFGTFDGGHVFIVDTFRRRNRLMADVVALNLVETGRWYLARLNQVQTVVCSEISNVGVHFKTLPVTANQIASIRFAKIQQGTLSALAVCLFARVFVVLGSSSVFCSCRFFQ